MVKFFSRAILQCENDAFLTATSCRFWSRNGTQGPPPNQPKLGSCSAVTLQPPFCQGQADLRSPARWLGWPRQPSLGPSESPGELMSGPAAAVDLIIATALIFSALTMARLLRGRLTVRLIVSESIASDLRSFAWDCAVLIVTLISLCGAGHLGRC